MARGGRREGAGRRLGTPNRRTVAKLIEASQEIAEAKKQNVPRAKTILSELMMMAMDYVSKYQQKMLAFECEPQNEGKELPGEIVDRFWIGMHAAGKFAAALAPYQDPKFTNIKVAMTPVDMPAEPKVIEGKSSKLDLNDPNECFRIYARMVRRVGS
jgi:hypothetical protein